MDPDALAGIGYTFAPAPRDATTTLRAAQATALALRHFPGSTVRDAKLVEVAGFHDVPPLHCVCWAVSIAPPPGGSFLASAGPHGFPRRPTVFRFMVVLLDAKTGSFVRGVTHSDFAPETGGH